MASINLRVCFLILLQKRCFDATLTLDSPKAPTSTNVWILEYNEKQYGLGYIPYIATLNLQL
jgi:hypothetical protein